MVELSGIMQGMQLLALIFLVALFCVVLAMSADLVSGWRKAEVRGEVHTSYAFSRTLTKSLIYFWTTHRRRVYRLARTFCGVHVSLLLLLPLCIYRSSYHPLYRGGVEH